jgi:protein phosphatase 1 regulatory subunit 7
MRQNLITSLVADDEDKPLEALTELEDLDLYDNKIPRVEGLEGLSKLKSVLADLSSASLKRSRTLDLSFNLIKHLPSEIFDTLTSLRTLYLVQNKVSKIAGLEGLAASLVSLELGGNRLRVSGSLTLPGHCREVSHRSSKTSTL